MTTILTKNEYDHRGRLTAIKHKIGSQDTVTVAAYTYNELGQLIGRSLGKKATEPDYVSNATLRYNELGWLKTSSAGNFSQQLWGTAPTPSSTFSYQYRLSSGTATGMSEAMLYDDMGNITELTRDATDINYSYAGNRISAVSGGLTGSYTYDANGNALTDRTGMNFRYNHLNLPDSAWNNGATVKVGYLYDANGNKLSKYSTQGGKRDYVGGIEYNGTTIELMHTGVGVAFRNNDGTYTYRYNLTDHWGIFDRQSTVIRPTVMRSKSYRKTITIHSANSGLSQPEIIGIFIMERKHRASLEANMIMGLGSMMRKLGDLMLSIGFLKSIQHYLHINMAVLIL